MPRLISTLLLFALASLPHSALAQFVPQDSTGLVPFFDNAGTPDPNVPVIDEGAVLLCIGMSQAFWECGGHPDIAGSPGWAAQSTLPVVIVTGAVSGWDIESIMADPTAYWTEVEARLRAAGYDNDDVQVMWGKNATRTAGQNNPDPIEQRRILRDGLIQIQQEADARFPNLRAGFHSSRVYGGHCAANPEPIAHETYYAIVGWDTEAGAIDSSSKWFLGPYIWADGTNARADGLTWLDTDFVMPPTSGPGCHPSQSGIDKVATHNEIFFSQLTYAPPGVTPPSAPTGLGVAVGGTSQLNLSWTDNSNDEASFRIERAPGPGAAFAEIDTTAPNATSYEDSGLNANTEYCYRVRASNANGNSAYTAQVCATTNASGGSAPAAPSGLTTTTSSDMGIDLSWTDNSSDEANFHVERATGPGGAFTEIATTAMNVTSFDSRGLAASTEYCYRVRASNASGNSAYTSMSCATTDASAPPPPPPPPPPGPGVQSSGGGVFAVAELGMLLLAGLIGLRRRKLFK